MRPATLLLPSPTRRTLTVAAFLLLTGSGCSSATGPQIGLEAGTYRVIFEMAPAITIPEALWGRHEVTFRVNAPAASASDVELVTSRLIPESGPTQDGYLVVDPALIQLNEGRWSLRFPYASGGYAVTWNMVELDNGVVTISPGCLGAVEGGGTYQGAGCRLDRL